MSSLVQVFLSNPVVNYVLFFAISNHWSVSLQYVYIVICLCKNVCSAGTFRTGFENSGYRKCQVFLDINMSLTSISALKLGGWKWAIEVFIIFRNIDDCKTLRKSVLDIYGCQIHFSFNMLIALWSFSSEQYSKSVWDSCGTLFFCSWDKFFLVTWQCL